MLCTLQPFVDLARIKRIHLHQLNAFYLMTFNPIFYKNHHPTTKPHVPYPLISTLLFSIVPLSLHATYANKLTRNEIEPISYQPNLNLNLT